MNKIIIFFFSLFLIFGCSTQNRIVTNEPVEMKIVRYNDDQREYIKNYILYRNFDVEIVDTENYLTIKNMNEEVLTGILRLVQLKMDLIANNIANANTTRTENGGPFIRKYINVSVENGVEIIEDTETPLRHVYDPNHPDAIIDGERKGFVMMPNVDIVLEMMDMIAISRLYENIMEYAKNNFKDFVW